MARCPDQCLCFLFSSHGSSLSSHSLLVISSVLAEAGVSLSLRWVLDVGVVQKILNSQENLLDRYSRPPILLFIQNGKAHCSRWVDIGVEKRWHKFDLWRGCWEVVLENDLSFVPGIPYSQSIKFIVPSAFFIGLAMKPNG